MEIFGNFFFNAKLSIYKKLNQIILILIINLSIQFYGRPLYVVMGLWYIHHCLVLQLVNLGC